MQNNFKIFWEIHNLKIFKFNNKLTLSILFLKIRKKWENIIKSLQNLFNNNLNKILKTQKNKIFFIFYLKNKNIMQKNKKIIIKKFKNQQNHLKILNYIKIIYQFMLDELENQLKIM